jgi:histidine phosphotransferase ChpT
MGNRIAEGRLISLVSRSKAIEETTMGKNPNLTLTGPDLAALLCSRVCHDVISPVGAINNGLELLDEGGADADAMDLIRTSALNASVRLKFARLAFGASGSVGASIDTGEAEKPPRISPPSKRRRKSPGPDRASIIAKNRVKLLLNLFLIAYTAPFRVVVRSISSWKIRNMTRPSS